MQVRFLLVALGAAIVLARGPAAEAADDREVITLPPEAREQFLAEMRGHMGNLDDVVAALAAGAFDEAADIAEARMDFGHRMWARMAEQGMSAQEIRRQKETMRKAGVGTGSGRGMGPGRYMPEHFRAMMGTMFEAAQDFAGVARGVGDPPTAADYRSVMEALGEVTAHCRGCHEAFRIQ
jgi:hypothetical protein